MHISASLLIYNQSSLALISYVFFALILFVLYIFYLFINRVKFSSYFDISSHYLQKLSAPVTPKEEASTISETLSPAPETSSKTSPINPSQVYGVEHLLRLFGKRTSDVLPCDNVAKIYGRCEERNYMFKCCRYFSRMSEVN